MDKEKINKILDNMDVLCFGMLPSDLVIQEIQESIIEIRKELAVPDTDFPESVKTKNKLWSLMR